MAAIMLLSLTAFVSSPAWSEDPAGAAEKAALTWIRLVDKGDYLGSWKESGEYFQRTMSAEKWSQLIYSVRLPLGQVTSRKLAKAEAHHTMPGAPDGEYFELVFKSSFTSKQSALEIVTLINEPKRGWRVVGYFIR